MGTDKAAHAVLPAVNRVAALVKRWVVGTLRDRISAQHLALLTSKNTLSDFAAE